MTESSSVSSGKIQRTVGRSTDLSYCWRLTNDSDLPGASSNDIEHFLIKDNGEIFDFTMRQFLPNVFESIAYGRDLSNRFVIDDIIYDRDVLFKGFLWKRRGVFTALWKRRFFVIRKDKASLCWYEESSTRESMIILGGMEIKGDTKFEKFISSDGIRCTLKTNKVKLELKSDSLSHMDEFIQAYEKVASTGAAYSIPWFYAFFCPGETSNERIAFLTQQNRLSAPRTSTLKGSRRSQMCQYSQFAGSPALTGNPLSLSEIPSKDGKWETLQIAFHIDSFSTSLLNNRRLCAVIARRVNYNKKHDKSDWEELFRTEIKSLNLDSSYGPHVSGKVTAFSRLAPTTLFNHISGSEPECYAVVLCVLDNLKLRPYAQATIWVDEQNQAIRPDVNFTEYNMDVYSVMQGDILEGITLDIGQHFRSATLYISRINCTELYLDSLKLDLGYMTKGSAGATRYTGAYAASSFCFPSEFGRSLCIESIYVSRMTSHAAVAYMTYRLNSPDYDIVTDVDSLDIDPWNPTVVLTECLEEAQARLRDEEGKAFTLEVGLGGANLRHSMAKKDKKLQGLAMNLNLHCLIGCFDSAAAQCTSNPEAFICMTDDGKLDDNCVAQTYSVSVDTLVVPNLTMGCPTAHALGFKNGGLSRYIFSEYPGAEEDLKQRLEAIADLHRYNRKHNDFSVRRLSDEKDLTKIADRKNWKLRLDLVTSQVLGLALTNVHSCIKLAGSYGGKYFSSLGTSLDIGFLVTVCSLLSSSMNEAGMLEDLEIAMQILDIVDIQFIETDLDPDLIDQPITINDSSDTRIRVKYKLDKQDSALVKRARIAFFKSRRKDNNEILTPSFELGSIPVKLCGIVFTQGVNERQTLATYSGFHEVKVQSRINLDSFKRISEYHRKFKLCHLSKISVPIHMQTALEYTEELKNKLGRTLIKNTVDKNVNVMIFASELAKLMGGLVTFMCKSGKDRTGQAVTLDLARELVRKHAVTEVQHVLDSFRSIGVRRHNVWANTGQTQYAFTNFQSSFLPACLRPPPDTLASANKVSVEA